MDTKWKSIKKVLCFVVFFLGVSLTIWNASGLLRRMPEKLSYWRTGNLLEDDYQQTWSFQNYMTNRLESFLSVAVNGCPGNWYYYGSGYFDSGWSDELYSWEEELALREAEATVVQDTEIWEGTDWDYYGYWDDWGYDGNDWEYWYERYDGTDPGDRENLTEEQKRRLELLEQRKQKLVEKYFADIKGDLNLLYSISYDGKLLYSNSDILAAEGSVQLPEGYNFLLYFDGEKVRIVKDGKEIDIYGDGYYRDDSNDWYVPGYRNFPVDEDMKKAVICMAAAEEPLLYTTGMDNSGGYRQQNNSLYWMRYNSIMDGKLLRWNLIGLTAGLALLFFSCLCRKGIRESAEKIAYIQGKIWVECKVLLLLAVLYAGWRECRMSGYGYGIWKELAYAYDYQWEVLSEYGGILLSELRYMSPLFWSALFWVIWLSWNDLRHNRKGWRHGLIAKCGRTISAREIKLPMARRMVRRNAVLFVAIIVSGILVLVGTLAAVDYGAWRYYNVWSILLWSVLITACFFLAAYLVGAKNIKAARDMDVLSGRIDEICRGNYSGFYEDGNCGSGMVSGDTGDAFLSGSGSDAGSGGTPGNGSTAENSAAHNLAIQGGGASSGKGAVEGDAALWGSDLSRTMAQLENIRQGMAGAVDEQMKSERMKVELIANVSHDLKTPLTSIISYVQFLKNEEGLPEHVQDYVKILDEKSQRLKNMVQDVFAVSKAASGELPMNMEMLDFGKLLRQTMADMDEEIHNSRVSFRTELPQEPVMIMADGQRMYRVFQNLFQNALKYSLDGSRVYVTLKADGKLAVASVKNTSHMELDEDKNFTERFVRGDKSRTDGGSGLGLSIAQSFTEACGGRFELEFNADLFIVKISFGIAGG